MSPAKKTKSPSSSRGLKGLGLALDFFTGRARTVLMLALLVAAAFLGGHWVWSRIGPTVLRADEYQLDPAKISITPPPPWIRSDVRQEVIRTGSLDRRLSMLDDDLARRVSDAFSLHPWVARVVRVAKHYPGGVDVELEYRRPVAVVESSAPGEMELTPIDGAGVRLPGDDFSPQEKTRYLRISGTTGRPVVGQPYADDRTRRAARIAEQLADHWRKWNLARIVAVRLESVSKADTLEERFELETQGGARVVWGSAGSAKAASAEPPAKEKIARLDAYFRRAGTLERTEGGEVLDARTLPPAPRD